jgi:dTDP-4-dehydrorhamnose 3,5-epimerase-like enzyme
MSTPQTQVIIEKLQPVSDVRGMVFEPLDAHGLRVQRNVHVVVTLPGHVRGNHTHRLGTEVSTVLGPAHVRYRESGQVTELQVPANEAWRFTFPPGVAHAFENCGETPMLIVSFNTQAHDPINPDTLRDPVQ